MNLAGLHHITMLTGDARRNVEFHADVLNLRLVKKTVNFDLLSRDAGRPVRDRHLVARLRRRRGRGAPRRGVAAPRQHEHLRQLLEERLVSIANPRTAWPQRA